MMCDNFYMVCTGRKAYSGIFLKTMEKAQKNQIKIRKKSFNNLYLIWVALKYFKLHKNIGGTLYLIIP